jgi:uncharacterized protein (DUF2237 family)
MNLWKKIKIVIISLCFLSTTAYGRDHEVNVFAKPLKRCCTKPMSGAYRDGYCSTGDDDKGTHVIAATVTQEFLVFTKSRGNDLVTASPEDDFPGLKPGDHWCLCAIRWREAEKAGVAPPINLNATNQKALRFIPLDILKKYGKKGW